MSSCIIWIIIKLIRTISIEIVINMKNRTIDQMYILFYHVYEAIVSPRRSYIS